jgi:phage baseplate assembly protein W
MNIDYPYQIGSRGRTATTDYDEHVRDMIEQLLFTEHGERVNRPDFGSGAMQLVFAPNSPELAATVQFTLQAALQAWLGDVIDLQSLTVTADDSQLEIDLNYVVRATGVAADASFVRAV